ncbi:MAG TPA: hypothetical protein VJV40_08625, partial [Thermodesulfobacteriota bacterium]|nr:hypothetical protein [Thermodesulfobacteriota bacterium]
MNMRKSILLLTLLVIGSVAVSVGFKRNFRSELGLLNDYRDMMVYAVRGSWYPYSKKPYTEVPSEYPQLATYFFAVPYIVLDFPGPLDTRLIGELEAAVGSGFPTNPNLPDSPHLRNRLFMRYSLVFSLLMVPFLFFSVLIVYKLRPDRKHLALLMLLPAGLYFTHNRFDIIPAFLGLLAIYLLSRERPRLSAFVIALGFLTKWYLVLLLPVFLTYCYTRSRKINTQMIFVFAVTCLAILLPAILSGGVHGLLAPYVTQLSRSLNQPSLFFLLFLFMNRVFGLYVYNIYSAAASLVLQFSAVPLCVTSRVDSIGKVIGWSLLSILAFIIFARINSPQWILWVSP